jgi:uncharacterized protein YaaR (DUF327 family)
MKVSDLGRRTAGSRVMDMKGAGSRGVQEAEPSGFSRTLHDMSSEAHNARLMQIKRDIEEQGQKLVDRVDVKEYEKYRRLIREFLDEIVSNGYTFSRENAFASRGGRHRYIATVETINKKLDELGKEVLSEQSDRIEILGKVDDIRGLLLDLML